MDKIIANSVLNGVPSVLSFRIDINPNDTSKKVVVLDQPYFTLAQKDLTADDKNEEAKKVREAYVNFTSTALQWIEPDKAPSDYDGIAKDILNLEVELAKIATKSEDRRDEAKKTWAFKKAELSKEFPGIDLALVVDEILRENKDKVEELIVADIDYFKKISEVLKGKLAVVNTHLSWKIVETYGSVVSEKFNNARFEFLKVTSGITEKPEQADDCVNGLVGVTPNVAGRVYIDAAGFGESDLKKAKDMVGNLTKAMEKIISEKDWMDDKTKDAAKEKLAAIGNHTNIAYPEWITKDDELTNSFPVKSAPSDDGFDLLSKLIKGLVTDSINKLDEKPDPSHEWPMSPALVNAAYEPTQNSITFPAAILRGVFYDAKRPDYLNYGAIGQVIGHEITHGFDDQGAQYGPDGRLHNWWSEETLKKFKEAADKMVKQYSDITDETTGLHLNGQNTQGENIADNGGIREAYNAYFGLKRNDLPLTGFEDWSPEKLFFLSYANVWCGAITPEELRNRINIDTHSPAEYRVNVPLKNFKAFSDAYGCKAGDKMNPEDKDRVEVW